MGYPLRIADDGAIYHVVTRGNNKRAIFEHPTDRRAFLELLDEVAPPLRWVGYAYCVMGNHVHLVVRTDEANISEGMRRILGRYAREHNRRTGRTGHVFGGRFRSYLVEDDRYLFAVIRYVLRNPVAAGLVQCAGDWEASSYNATIEPGGGSGFLDPYETLGLFHRNPRHAGLILADFIHEGVESPEMSDPPLRPPLPVHVPTPAQLAVALDARSALRECIDRGHRQTAIAAALGLTPGAVSKQLRKQETKCV